MTPARTRVLAAAQAAVGLTGDDYRALVAAPELEAGDVVRANEIATMSGCERTWRAIVDTALGIPGQLYTTGDGFGDLYRVAGGSPWKPGGAVRLARLDSQPQVGDAIIYGASASAVAHVDACVVAAELRGTVLLVSVIAGGQRDAAGGETVKLLTRTLRWQRTHWEDVANGRPVLAVCDPDLLAAHVGWSDPDAAPDTQPSGAAAVDAE